MHMDSPLETIGVLLGVTLCGVVVLQAAAWAGRSWMRAARREKVYRQRREEFREKVRAALRRAQARSSHLAWKGYRPFRVAAIVDEAADVKSFYLTPADGLSLPAFEPGQYVTLHVQPPGEPKPIVRCYSLSDRPREDYYRCTIKRLAPPPDRPDLPAGRASNALHKQVHVGDLLELQAPRGEFFLDPLDDHPVVLIGGGIGVTPLVSMLNTITAGGPPRDVYFLLGVQNSWHHPFKENLATVAAQHPNVHLHVSYSQPLASDRLGIDYHAAGRITIERLRELLPSSNYRFYVCGPGPMMETLVPALLEWGVPAEHINYEAFGPASVKSIAHARSEHVGTDKPCEVAFARQGAAFTWDGSFDSLLEFAEANGCVLDSGCRAGNCGQCLAAIKSGAVATIKEPGVQVEPGHCLTCVSVPTGPLVLDT